MAFLLLAVTQIQTALGDKVTLKYLSHFCFGLNQVKSRRSRVKAPYFLFNVSEPKASGYYKLPKYLLKKTLLSSNCKKTGMC